MIQITELNGKKKYINADLVEMIDQVPETMLVLVNGHRFMVKERVETLVERITEYKQICGGGALRILQHSKEWEK